MRLARSNGKLNFQAGHSILHVAKLQVMSPRKDVESCLFLSALVTTSFGTRFDVRVETRRRMPDVVRCEGRISQMY